MRVEYRTLFQEFNGSTQYSVRMKGEDAQGKASTYVSVAFKTPDEQLFTGVEVTANSRNLDMGRNEQGNSSDVGSNGGYEIW